MTAALLLSSTMTEKPNALTQAALGRLRRAMRDIEAEIRINKGIYPFNYGRVTQSELCRRADVKKATLQNPVHKDTTRVEIIEWLAELNSKLTKTRDDMRERVTAVTEDLSSELQSMTLAFEQVQERLASAEKLIEQLSHENAAMKAQLNIS
jgi:chromosome segregation ATPase